MCFVLTAVPNCELNVSDFCPFRDEEGEERVELDESERNDNQEDDVGEVESAGFQRLKAAEKASINVCSSERQKICCCYYWKLA